MLYNRLCRYLNDVGILIPSDANVYDHISDLSKDWYCSVYKYTEEQKKQAEEEITIDGKTRDKGVGGINNVVTNKLIFDFDINHKATNFEDVKKDALELCTRLIEKGTPKEALQICFSGNKGFSVCLDTTQTFTPDEHRAIASSLAANLASFDTKMYNASRIFRVPFTRHPESLLYKIPLTLNELAEANGEEIRGWAKNEYEVSLPATWAVTDLPASIIELKQAKPATTEEPKNAASLPQLNMIAKPSWLSNWKYAILNGYFPKGSRSYALMILAATLKHQGLPKEIAYRMLKGAAELQSLRFNDDRFDDRELYNNVIGQVYGPFWKGGTYSEDSFPDELKDYLEEAGIPRKVEALSSKSPLIPIDQVYDTFADFAENIDKNTIKTGIKELDEKVRITTSMLVGLLASPAAGKTTASLQILNANSLTGEECIFASYDMGAPLIYQNLARRSTGKSSEEIFDAFKYSDEKAKAEIREAINWEYKNVSFSFKTGSTVDDLKEHIIAHEERTGKKVRLVVVDYLEKIMGGFTDATANSAAAAAKLQSLANELALCVIVLLQPQKIAGDPSVPLLTYRNIKGASVIEQDCRVVISLYREGYSSTNYNNDNYITFNILKNTMGTLGQVDCAWDGRKGEIFELDDNGKTMLQSLREDKKRQKELDDDF